MMDKFSKLRATALSALLIVSPAGAAIADVPGVPPENRSVNFQLMSDPDGVPDNGDEIYFSPEWIQQAAEQQVIDVRNEAIKYSNAIRSAETDAEKERLRNEATVRLRSLQSPLLTVSDQTARNITQEEFFEAAADRWDTGNSIQRYAIVVDKKMAQFTPEQVANAQEEALQRYAMQQDQIIARAKNLLTVIINNGYDTNGELEGKEVPHLALEYGFGGLTTLYAVQYDPQATRLLNDGVTEVPVKIGDIIPVINNHSAGYDYETGSYHNILTAEGMAKFAQQLGRDAQVGLHTMARNELGDFRREAQNIAQNGHAPAGAAAADTLDQ